MREPSQRQRVSLSSKPCDHAISALRNKGMVAKFLALVDVRDVHLDNDAVERVERIENGYRSMGECGRIDNDPQRVLPRLVDPVDDLILTIRLVKADLKPMFSGDLAAIGLDIGKGFMAVDMGRALAA